MYQNVTYPENEEDSRAALEQMRPGQFDRRNDQNQWDVEMSYLFHTFQKTSTENPKFHFKKDPQLPENFKLLPRKKSEVQKVRPLKTTVMTSFVPGKSSTTPYITQKSEIV